MSREQLADALSGAEYVVRSLPDLIEAERERAGLTWQQAANEMGLPMMTVYNVGKRLREARSHTMIVMISWLHCRTRPDPTHGRIDRDIQAYVNGMNPTDVAQRTAMENTIQAKRDSGERLAVDR